MTDKVNLHKLPTGVPGLDMLLGGGISKYSFVVLTGAPGSGKTTLAHQIMFALANEQRKALFFTILGEAPLKMLRFQQQYHFFDPAKVGTSIRYVNLADDLQTNGFEGVLQRILAEVQAFQPELIFVDSFKSVVQATRATDSSMASLQFFVQQLGVQLSTWQATTFLIGEYADSTQEENPIFTVADGVIHVCQHLDENAIVRKIRIVKMRGSAHMTGLHCFRMTDAGLHVYPRLLNGGIVEDKHGTDAFRNADRRLSTGNPVLDSMLHGGVPMGYSVVVGGPSGVGKTVLATAFLKAGADAGEKGIIASFENRFFRASNAPLARMIDAGDVHAVHPLALDLSIEEVVTQLAEAAYATKATRLVIDSLTALELILAPQFRANFQESLFRMLASLHARGVTVMLIRNLPDSEQIFTPGSFIVDAIILLRYVEKDGHLRKLISIPKLRGSSHSSEVRVFDTFEDGITIGSQLS